MRFSTAEQAKGDTLARQRDLAMEYLARRPEKNLFLAQDEYVDEGVSSFTGQNLQPGRALHRFLDDVKGGRIPSGSVLMVESLDRISRQQVLESQRLLLDILVSNINVITTSPSEEREYSRTSGLHDLIISLAGMERANQESAMKSDRVRRAWKRKKQGATTTKLTSRAPAWLRLSADRSHFEVLEKQSEVVRRVFELATTMGQHSIARILNSKGVEPFMAGSAGWHSSSVVKLLNSSAVIGIYEPHERDPKTGKRVPDGPPIPDYYPSVIDEATYFRVRALRLARRHGSAGRKGSRFSNLFTGLAKCAVCKGPMVMVNKGRPPKGGAYLVCSSARRNLGCGYRSVRYGIVERAFLTMCQNFDVTALLPTSVETTVSTRLRNAQDALDGEIATKRDLMGRIVESLAKIDGQVAQSINDKLLQYEQELVSLGENRRQVAEQLSLAAVGEARTLGLKKNFMALLLLMQQAEETEQYVIRSRFNEVLKTALADFTIGPSPANLVEELNAETDQNLKLLEAVNPDVLEALKNAEIKSHRHVSGSLSIVKVAYKSGWGSDLAIDALGLVGVRVFRISDSAELDVAPSTFPPGQWGIVVSESHIKDRPKQPRNANGKFAKHVPSTSPLTSK
jgi:DNA invertase Pin-like site-specific DNA recombinase